MVKSSVEVIGTKIANSGVEAVGAVTGIIQRKAVGRVQKSIGTAHCLVISAKNAFQTVIER